MSLQPEVQYIVVPDSTNPFLLARVRWPDVAQAITAGCPDWLEDPGLFDLPQDPSSVAVTFDRAAAIAGSWGVNLDSEGTFLSSGPSLIRRMPADWSNLVPAEIHAWSLDFVDTGRRVKSRRETSRARGRHASSRSRMHPGRWFLGVLTRPRRRPGVEVSIPSIAIPETPFTIATKNGHVPTIVLSTEETVLHAVAPEEHSPIAHGDELESPSIGKEVASTSPRLNGAHKDHAPPSPRGRRGSPGTKKNMNGTQPSGANGSNGSNGSS
ncbi:MAG TPA: hypothetical protein VID75_07640 [Acidimicrobiales bacterium]|jgi:hypothetical protein